METTASPVIVRHAAWKPWANPIFRRYCRSRLRPQGLGICLLITVLIAGFIFSLALSFAGNRGHLEEIDAARTAIIPLMIFQGLVLFVLGTAQVSGGMVAERDEGVIDYQRLIPMGALAKVFGYVFGLPVREYVMVFATLPFTAWSLWKGEVAMKDWLPLYTVFFSSGLLYHFTGLVTGTVVKNRRWAFLVSIGLVFCLYTVIPQMANLGMVFFKYLTVMPVAKEHLPGSLPRSAGALVAAGQHLVPTVKFFNLDFSETVFTLFSQGGLVLTFVSMLARRWQRGESHLLGKAWATVFFIWIQILLLGNAIPLMEPGTLFPSHDTLALFRGMGTGAERGEAATMCGLYGVVTLGLLLVMSRMITPTPDQQVRGWQRTRKQGRKAMPFFSDTATATWCTAVMALAGAAGWYLFTRNLVESRWFPGHHAPLSVFYYFAAVMLAVGLGFQVLLETMGARVVGLATILIGAAPVMIGVVVGVVNNNLLTPAAWLVGMSPASLPVYAVCSELSVVDLPDDVALAVPRAFQFWLLVSGLAACWLMVKLRSARSRMARRILDADRQPADLNPERGT